MFNKEVKNYITFVINIWPFIPLDLWNIKKSKEIENAIVYTMLK